MGSLGRHNSSHLKILTTSTPLSPRHQHFTTTTFDNGTPSCIPPRTETATQSRRGNTSSPPSSRLWPRQNLHPRLRSTSLQSPPGEGNILQIRISRSTFPPGAEGVGRSRAGMEIGKENSTPESEGSGADVVISDSSTW